MRAPQGRRWVGVAFGVLAATALMVAAAGWLLSPEDASKMFGIPLAGSSVSYGYIKGVQDLLAALLILVFLIRGERRSAGISTLIALLIPVTDIAIVYRAIGSQNIGALAAHLPFIVLMSLAALFLCRE